MEIINTLVNRSIYHVADHWMRRASYFSDHGLAFPSCELLLQVKPPSEVHHPPRINLPPNCTQSLRIGSSIQILNRGIGDGVVRIQRGARVVDPFSDRHPSQPVDRVAHGFVPEGVIFGIAPGEVQIELGSGVSANVMVCGVKGLYGG